MRILSSVLFAALLLVVGPAIGTSPTPFTASADAVDILGFEGMTPVQGAFVGPAMPIRGVAGGGVPWVVDRARGELGADGRVEIDVRGLVLATTGANPSPFFKAIVSCLSTTDGATVNVSTALFEATTTGDAVIKDTVSLPRPCVAPIVFVTNPAGRWFAVSGG